jgi:carbon starvation protein CstA
MLKVVGAVFLTLALFAVSLTAQDAGVFPGQRVPRFALQDLSGKAVSLDEMERGASRVVLHFWGTY